MSADKMRIKELEAGILWRDEALDRIEKEQKEEIANGKLMAKSLSDCHEQLAKHKASNNLKHNRHDAYEDLIMSGVYFKYNELVLTAENKGEAMELLKDEIEGITGRRPNKSAVYRWIKEGRLRIENENKEAEKITTLKQSDEAGTRLDLRDLMARFKVGRTTIWQWQQDNNFPKPKRFGNKNIWLIEDILEFEKNNQKN